MYRKQRKEHQIRGKGLYLNLGPQEDMIRFPVRAHAQVVGTISVWGMQEAANQWFSLITDVSISLSVFLSEINKNIFFKNHNLLS